MTILETVNAQMRHDRKTHQQRRDYTLAMNAATAEKEIAPYKDAAPTEDNPLTYRYGFVGVHVNEALPDDTATLVIRVPRPGAMDATLPHIAGPTVGREWTEDGGFVDTVTIENLSRYD